jgi:hypothetical protein
MSDFLWYTRLLVWVGCGALLIEALAGKSFGYLTVVAVVFLVVGFVGFLGALALEGRPLAWLAVPAEGPDSVVMEPPSGETGRSDAPIDTRGETSVLTAAPAPASPAEFAAELAPPIAAARAARPAGQPREVRTRELAATSQDVGNTCPYCGRELLAGQIVAVCWACEATQHASCWTENRFRCATPGCAGAGSLQAPESLEGPSSP